MRTKCKGCKKYFTGAGEYCSDCEPGGLALKDKWARLMDMKLHIQKQEDLKRKAQKARKEAEEEVRRLGQTISDLRQKLMEMIG